MKAIITSPLLTGLGDMFTSLYWTWCRQEELKSLGYKTKCILSCTQSFYTSISSIEDCSYLSEIFNLDELGDWELNNSFDVNIGNFFQSENYKLVNNYLNVVRCYVEKENPINSLDLLVFGEMWRRDDLINKNLFNIEISNYCISQIKKFPNDFYLIHFRQDDFTNHDTDFALNEPAIESFINNNSDKNIIFISSSGRTKSLMKNKGYSNVFFNEFKQGDTWICNLKSNNLIEYLKLTLIDMFLFSYAKKILRIGVMRNSMFCTFGIVNNNSSVPNAERFI